MISAATLIRRTALGVAAALVLTSCAALNVNALPQPGQNRDRGYDVILEFANVLNLPDRAKVVQDGTTVGVVNHVDLRADHVDVTARIDSGVSVPADVHATLQQSTVLGDTYLALERPQGEQGTGTPAIGPGARVPLSQTTSPPQLEDTIANLANFVGSGSIQRIQNTIIGLNNVTPHRREDLRAMTSRVTTDLADLRNNIDTVDTWLQGTSNTVAAVIAHLPEYKYWLSPDGMLGFDRGSQTGSYIGTVLPSIGSIYSGGFWLVPLLNSLADALGAVQQSKWNFEAEGPAWRRLFYEDFLPVDKNPAINITSITGPDGKEMIDNIQDVMRVIGAMP